MSVRVGATIPLASARNGHLLHLDLDCSHSFISFGLGNKNDSSDQGISFLCGIDSNEFYVPIGVRVGKVIPGGNGKGSWNFYVEAQTSWVYDNYPDAAKDSSWRFNVTRTLPAGF